MQTSQKRKTTAQEMDSYCWPPKLEQYCTLDSSSVMQNSSSIASFSPNGSPDSQLNHSYPMDLHGSPNNTCGSPVSDSCVTDNEHDLSHMIRQLETAMLGIESDNTNIHPITGSGRSTEVSVESEKLKYMTEMITRGDLKELLCACAKAIENKDMYTTDCLVTQLRQMVSVSGEPKQRLGAYLLEGLVARLASSGSSIYKALRCKEPASAELLSYMHILYEICPYFKFGYMSANGAIAEAMKDESRIHIIDFQIAQGSQWVTLIHAAAISGTEVQLENLGIRPGEAIAINFAMVLHHMPDESVGTLNHRDRLLRLAKSLSPKVVTLVEQEANTNTAPFVQRFVETMNHYLAIFESIDVSQPRDHKERMNVEQHCLAREIVNIIACEGAERVERHEVLGKWRSRFVMAGFKPRPLSSFVSSTIKTLLQGYCDKYTFEDRDGVLYLGWMNRAIIASCAWRC